MLRSGGILYATVSEVFAAIKGVNGPSNLRWTVLEDGSFR
jgi:hypothetical protein